MLLFVILLCKNSFIIFFILFNIIMSDVLPYLEDSSTPLVIGSGYDKPYTQLVYPEISGNNASNVLLVSSEVMEYETFVNSVNENTYPITYASDSTKADLYELLKKNFTSIDRLALVFNRYCHTGSLFLDIEPLFLANDYAPYSENVQFIINIIKEFGIKNIDFLACETLLYPNYVEFYNILTRETGVIVGASNNKTGNIKYGGDWVMENTSQNVEDIYFTKNIEYYTYVLGSVYVDGFYLTLYTTTAVLDGGNQYQTYGTTTTLPSSVTYGGVTYTVNSTTSYAFQKTNITNVIIPNSYTSAGQACFYECGSLLSITFPTTTFSVPSEFAVRCRKLVTLNNFQYANIDNARIAFQTTGLTSVTLPSTATYIPAGFLKQCGSLTTVTAPSTLTTIGGEAFQWSNQIDAQQILNQTPNLTSIGASAFNQCNRTIDLIIPEKTVDIGGSVFAQITSLRTVTFSNNSTMTTLSGAMFTDSRSLTSVILPDSIETIQGQCFYSCRGLTTVKFPAKLKSIGDICFCEAPLTTLTLPPLVNYIGNQAFLRCNLNKVYFTSTTALPYIYPGAFGQNQNPCIAYCDDVNIPGSIQTLSALGIFTSVKSIYPIVPSVICFPGNTPIKTDQGLINIDKINTDKNTIRGKKIVAITRTITDDKYLICFEKDSLGKNIPSERTLISQNHRIFYNGKLIKAKEFLNDDESVNKVKYTGEVLYNVLMEEHDKMIVNNLICETLHPDNGVAKVYTAFNKLSLEEQLEFAEEVSKMLIKNNKTVSKNAIK